MGSKSAVTAIRNFLGVNRRDGADLVADNEFFNLTNWYPRTKGLFYKREGTTQEFQASNFPAVAGIRALKRYSNVFGERETLYYCQPDAGVAPVTQAPNTHTLTDLGAGTGDLFNGGAAAPLNFRYSWVGRGFESAASLAQNILVGGITNGVRVQVPAFPTGIKSANVFMNGQFCGVITTSNGTLDVKQFFKAADVGTDALGSWITEFHSSGLAFTDSFGTGSLKAGTYYLTACWFGGATQGFQSCASATPTTDPYTNQYLRVTVPADGKSIRVGMYLAAGASTNGATYVMFFIGTKPPDQGPMLYAGMRKLRTATTTDYTQPEILEITSIPSQINAATIPYVLTSTRSPIFYGGFNATTDPGIGLADVIYKKNAAGSLVEILPSRSQGLTALSTVYSVNPFTGGSYTDPNPNRQNVALNYLTTFNVSIAEHQGELWLGNSVNLLMHTDGFIWSEMAETPGTVHPGLVAQVYAFKDQLAVTVKRNDFRRTGAGKALLNLNQVFCSKVLDPTNFADGGSGSALRFATVGDGFAEGISSLGIFNFNSATDGPSTFLACFKKSSLWLLSNIPDSVSNVTASANCISGKVGCLAPETAVQTNIGLFFLGNDGDVYMASSSGAEPRRVGNRIRPLLEHLPSNDVLMRMCTATFHRGFYKLSYPSTATSTGNDAQLWADLRTEQGSPITWCGPHTGINVDKQIVYSGEGDPETRLCTVAGVVQTAILDDLSTYQDLGVPMPSVMEWKTSRFGAEINKKRYMGIVFDAYYDTQFNHQAMLEGFADDQYSQINKTLSAGTAIWNTSNFDAANWGDAMYFAVPFMFGPDNLVGRTFRWKLTHTGNAQMIIAAGILSYIGEHRAIYG